MSGKLCMYVWCKYNQPRRMVQISKRGVNIKGGYGFKKVKGILKGETRESGGIYTKPADFPPGNCFPV